MGLVGKKNIRMAGGVLTAAAAAESRLRPCGGRAAAAAAKAEAAAPPRRPPVRSLLPVVAPAALLIVAGVGVRAATLTGAGDRPPACPPALAPAPPAMTPPVMTASDGGSLEARLGRLLQESERHGEARIGRAELGRMLAEPRSPFLGQILGQRLRRLLRDSEESGEARVSRAELEQMVDWTRMARQMERQMREARGGGPAGAPP